MSELEDKANQAKMLIQEWVDKQGHDRCWYYPEIFTQLASLFGVTVSRNPSLPPRSEFEEGCGRYQLDQYGSNIDRRKT